eukprot:GILI01000620.1.p1 GENE.GILI01000620.1~~GILI01000620.1.p1  ORF type:complete len:396 (-),score=99.53 GILI01000620.1:415-1488(-)
MATNTNKPAATATSGQPTSSSSQPVIMEEFRDICGQTPQHRYREKKAVGKGSFGTVWQMVQNSTGRVVVGKFMDTTKMTEKNRNFALGEAVNAAKCEHPNIIEFIEKFEKNGKLLLVFEYADAGDLFAQVNARAPSRYFRESEILLIMAQLCLSLNHLHERRMMHRDLKTPNIFLTTCGLIKLGDFGFSRQYEDALSTDVGSTFCGTPYYLAPELWNQAPYSKKADIWSLGVILYELMSLKKPFTGNGMRELIDRVIAGKFHALPNHYSAPLITLCTAMLSVDPRQRPSIKVIFQNEAMRQGGLLTLRKNVPRLSGVPEAVRNAMIKDIEDILGDDAKGLNQPQDSPQSATPVAATA